jgi:hypothetical protein
MSAKRRAAAEFVPSAIGAITAAFERQKHNFLARHAVECPYLLVQLQPDLPGRRLTVIVSYALSADRAWQQAETHVAIAELQTAPAPEVRFAEAFARLDEAMGAARIARLFAPRSETQRLDAGR